MSLYDNSNTRISETKIVNKSIKTDKNIFSFSVLLSIS